VPGIRNVSVAGDESPTEVHIVADAGRSPKQIARDVQSLAAAALGLQIDHRIVSVVQIGAPRPALQDGPRPSSGPRGHRPLLERVVLASTTGKGWVKVALRWHEGSVTEGARMVTHTRESRARGACDATATALCSQLEGDGSLVEVEDVAISRVGATDSVVVRARYYQNGTNTDLIGSAIVRDDVATAAARALLHAVNRKLF
jgi:hypothetical protein